MGFVYFNVCLSLLFLRVNQGGGGDLLIPPGFRQGGNVRDEWVTCFILSQEVVVKNQGGLGGVGETSSGV
jgi:hypothetical protein